MQKNRTTDSNDVSRPLREPLVLQRGGNNEDRGGACHSNRQRWWLPLFDLRPWGREPGDFVLAPRVRQNVRRSVRVALSIARAR